MRMHIRVRIIFQWIVECLIVGIIGHAVISLKLIIQQVALP
jgi:hypothetical protein